MPAFDQLLRRLAEAEARFVLVGGLALGAGGVVRGTKDVDIVVDPDPANFKLIAEAAGGQTSDAWMSSKVSREFHPSRTCAPEQPRPRYWASRSPSARSRTSER
ncbi:MAG TPA: hypothetical protein VGH14_19010 [Solirubrobacterales bacterium]